MGNECSVELVNIGRWDLVSKQWICFRIGEITLWFWLILTMSQFVIFLANLLPTPIYASDILCEWSCRRMENAGKWNVQINECITTLSVYNAPVNFSCTHPPRHLRGHHFFLVAPVFLSLFYTWSRPNQSV